MTFRLGRLALLAIIIIFLFSASKLTGVYVDWLFFREVAYEGIFTKVLSAEVLTGLAFGLIFFFFLAANVLAASAIKVPPIDILF
ncbi:MAG: UPF0182 family protein, partial [Syntrophorhabdaceae bacterium]|nr:UPF0182 family protein [Syntrophorhabdaceae bacterium]